MLPFRLFGSAHLGAMAAIAGTALAGVWLVRSRPAIAPWVRRILALAMLVLAAVALISLRREGVPWAYLAPLHLCDAAIFVAAFALLTLRPLACELAYFWGAAGTVLAVVTPDLAAGFPALEFFTYFALHGAVVVSAVLLPFGLGCRPRPGAVWRVWLWTNAYAAAVAAVNLLFGTNFLYLMGKPAGPTPLDWFGPWPVYLLVAEVVAVGLFALLALPFRRRR